jgi:hypothetical protein
MSKDTGVVLIHGREYETVALRVKKFRADPAYKDWSLITEIVERNEDAVVCKASILDANDCVRATGHAEEYRKSSQINKTSALENAETSAIGRCLAALGLGGTEFATADEVANAIHQQSKGVHKPTDGSWDHISQERAKVIHDTAIQVKDYLREEKDLDAYGLIETSKFEADEKVAIWTLFDSKERRRLKDAAKMDTQTQP